MFKFISNMKLFLSLQKPSVIFAVIADIILMLLVLLCWFFIKPMLLSVVLSLLLVAPMYLSTQYLYKLYKYPIALTSYNNNTESFVWIFINPGHSGLTKNDFNNEILRINKVYANYIDSSDDDIFINVIDGPFYSGGVLVNGEISGRSINVNCKEGCDLSKSALAHEFGHMYLRSYLGTDSAVAHHEYMLKYNLP